MLEEELVVAVKLAGLDLNDTLNIALEDRLKHRKYSDAVTSVMAST
ncbi:MAG: hypothetical protein RBT82_12450 [Desulfomonilia bacterium]|nr:hypothetical protein [Desulfomonilia bacterium]